MIRINLGSGNRPFKDWVNVDSDALCNPDKVVDLNKTFPFKDNSVDEIHCSHLIEHVDNVMDFMYEIWRVCKNGASVTIIAPCCYYLPWAIQPHHKRFIRPGYFEMWTPPDKHPNKNIVENWSTETKGAMFETVQDQMINEARELLFKLKVVKK